MNKLFIVLLIVVSGKTFAQTAQSTDKPITIVHSGTHSDEDYVLQLLSAALKKAGDQYQPKELGYFPPRGRDFVLMEQKQGIDILWGSAREDREARFRTIRIPLFKGLIGWRIPLLHQQSSGLFAATHSIDDLKKFRPGQHFRWTDTRILKHNGINVFEVNNHSSLMGMLINNKFDYYPRAIFEVTPEYEEYKSQGVVIDSNIIIVYPTAFYFYVHKDNHALAANLTQGLESLIASGEMDQLFYSHFGGVLKNLAIHKRKLLRLENPFLPREAPLKRKELWLDPENLSEELLE